MRFALLLCLARLCVGLYRIYSCCSYQNGVRHLARNDPRPDYVSNNFH
jgi:hypothetical protein